MTLVSIEQWEEFLSRFPEHHILQTSTWATVKSQFGWHARRVVVENCGAQILFRRLPLGLSLAYIPKAPLGEAWQPLWQQVDALCRQEKAIFLKVEPDGWETPAETLQDNLAGFQVSAHAVQPLRTVVIDLRGSDEEILARMKQKTRYNIRLAEKKDVKIIETDDLPGFHAMMQVTGSRDGFAVHSLVYYQQTWQAFKPHNQCALLQAQYQGKPLAALMVFAQGSRAWYFYGASNNAERNRMPTYLLQWQAMQWAKARGCTSYDLWGVPDVDESELEANFETRSDGLWGVYRFKRGFGGNVMRAQPAYDRVYKPLLYRAYCIYLKRRGGVD